MSSLNQIQLSFNAEQDRLLLSISTGDFTEFRFWITRRVCLGFWKMLQHLQQVMHKDEEDQRVEMQESQKQIHREKTTPEAEKYTTPLSQRPLGDEPLLLFKFSAKADDENRVYFHFEDPNGIGIDFAGEGILVTILSQLLFKSLSQADWNLQL